MSSYTVALAVHQLRRGKTRAAVALTAATIALGLCFLAIKTTEYLEHFREGIYPGGAGAFFETHRAAGIEMFFTLYFCMTAFTRCTSSPECACSGFCSGRSFAETSSRPRRIRSPSGPCTGTWSTRLDLPGPLFYLVPGTAR